MDLNNIDLSDLTLDNMGTWPVPVKIGLCIAAFAITLFVAYWFDTKEQIAQLNGAEKQEIELRSTFETKQKRAANLDAYKLQLIQIKKSFGNMLHRLPSKTEVPGLLEDISKTGITVGLEFKLFDPQREIRHDFYAELPIHITIAGNYHLFGEFVSKIAALHRIVTLHDFKITLMPKNDKLKKEAGKQRPLLMDMTAKTYRAIELNGGGQ